MSRETSSVFRSSEELWTQLFKNLCECISPCQATVRGILTNLVYTGTVYLGRSRPVQARQRHSAPYCSMLQCEHHSGSVVMGQDLMAPFRTEKEGSNDQTA